MTNIDQLLDALPSDVLKRAMEILKEVPGHGEPKQ